MSFNERVVEIERKLEEITVLLIGMQSVLNTKGSQTPKTEIQNIVFDMQKIIDETERLKKDT